ncbi:hypothetical protein C497_11438 [Halalkalicoccus jeotgali B3]|uniref:Uncharacterized protein n=2 Tax=Halalkalicoccus jeotgali TaxID=413810 RepID=D8J5D1_HALJB|nr:hypothetical protein HacjB3_11220 [Halalkalicoccus jeotgali B3]ELY36601.1 hypothetical protein C497_11438 [Halalkalicoccus jeotgali B3]
MAEKAEQLYAQLNEVKKQLEDLRVKVDNTHETVTGLEVKHEQNRALLEALAEERGIDVEKVITEASIEDIEEPDPAEDAAGDVADDPDTTTGTDPVDGDEGVGTETS